MRFADEQRALRASCWQLVGLADDLAGDDAWVRRSVFGLDVFVQRFGDELRGFHNVCAHRGFPLRTEDRGRGPVKCGFHGWGYNKDGVPTTIPRSAELFALSREQREALALPALRVETVGRFVFATASPDAPDLATHLGPIADVFRATSLATERVIYRESFEVAADWKRHAEVSLDDYHLPSVHGTTFGSGPELAPHQVVYQRHGWHSSYLKRRDADWSFDGFWKDAAAGTMDRTGYKIFNLYPDTVLATTRDTVIASVTYPLAEDRFRIDTYMFAWRASVPMPEDAKAIASYFATVFREDRDTCERWERGDPTRATLGALEGRVAWFRETHAEVMARRAAAG